MVNVDAYLDRIAYTGPCTPDATTLAALHRAHLLAVPFENLDIALGRPITLDLPSRYEKIVTRRRGGFCYELNGLFAWLLRELGYDVALLAAGVYGDDDQPDPNDDHLTLLVRCPGDPTPWLADVGFGEGFREPLRLDVADEQIRNGRAYRVEGEGQWRYWEQDREGAWKPRYWFTLTPRQYGDFAEMCRWQQTSPDSHFTRNRVCSLATSQGRVTLADMTLIVTENGRRHETPIADDAAYQRLLRDRFGVDLTL